MNTLRLLCVTWVAAFLVGASARSEEPRLQDFAYPFAVHIFSLATQQQTLEMAYMDVPSRNSQRGTVVLLHGKNFSGAYWEQTANALADAGYRVIIPDQVGFGKSSKPAHYQFSFHQLAANTHELLRKLGVSQVHVLGHSMGGMIAARYALMFPNEVATLVLTNPLGLEDWKAKGVPYTGIDAAYAQELKQTPEKVKQYQLENYYAGNWKPEYQRWVDMLGEFIASPEYPRMAWDQALTSEMIFTQPVIYEFPQIKAPTLFIIGQRDRTAPGRNLAPPDQREALGKYPELGRAAASAIPGAKLVELDGLGHLPHIEAFDSFIGPLKDFLANRVGSAPAR
jgi:pimeloyl-ACP methyl ester carboxylesterase